MTHVILAVSYRAEMLEKEIEAKEQEVRYPSNYIKKLITLILLLHASGCFKKPSVMFFTNWIIITPLLLFPNCSFN